MKKYIVLFSLFCFIYGCTTIDHTKSKSQTFNIEVLGTMSASEKDPLVYILDLNTNKGKFYHKHASIQNWKIIKIEFGQVTFQNNKSKEIRIVEWSERAKHWAGY